MPVSPMQFNPIAPLPHFIADLEPLASQYDTGIYAARFRGDGPCAAGHGGGNRHNRRHAA